VASIAYQLNIKPTFKDLSGRFTKAEKELIKERREQLKVQARRLVNLAEEEAPRASGEFASNIRFRTFQDSEGLGFRVTTQQPLGTFIQEGTRPHPIVARRAKALHFFIGGQEFFRTSVKHPGTRPNKFMGKAVRRWKPGARRMLREISTRYTQVLRGTK
jgi:hypothetical protein